MDSPAFKTYWSTRFLALIIVFSALAGSTFGQASLNMTLLANWDNNSLPTIGTAAYSDVWGYAANGREYAIIGTVEGFYIIDISAPATPSVVTFQTCASNNSFWRDFKTYGNYLYAVSDQGASSALEIYDLSGLPSGITQVYNSQTFFSTCHNIQINQSTGRLYAAGTTTSPNGVVILDIQTDPSNPALLANFALGAYTHDIYVHEDTLVAFFGNTGVGLFDFANIATPSAMTILLSYLDPGYAHSGWATDDFSHLYWTTETVGTGIKISDFSTAYNLDVVDTFRTALLAPTFNNSTAHNTFVKGNTLYVSYYKDGVVLYDITNPTVPVRTGYFDTHPQNTDYGTDFNGCWGVYPYLPSGIIIASDQENGLFILDQNTTFPVELINYRIENLDDEVKLMWTTTREVNHDRFIVERSGDGENFEPMEVIHGQGDSEIERDYEIYDYQPLEGQSFYRLQQVDQDGSTTYTEVLSVRRDKAFHFIGAVPNPAQAGQQVRIEYDLNQAAKVELTICNLMGQVLHHRVYDQNAGYQRSVVNTDNWTSGAYLVKLTVDGNSHTSKLLLSK